MKDKKAETTLEASTKTVADDDGMLFKEISCDMGNEFNLIESTCKIKNPCCEESLLRK